MQHQETQVQRKFNLRARKPTKESEDFESSPVAENVPSTSPSSVSSIATPPEQQPLNSQTYLSTQQQKGGNANLLITELRSIAQDTSYAKNGQPTTIHLVAKHVPFKIKICSSQSLKKGTIQCDLVFQEDQSLVPPPHGSSKTLEYDAAFSPNNENVALITLKTSILTSQHNGRLFCIRVMANDDVTFSEPLRIISKRSHVKKILERSRRHLVAELDDQSEEPSKRNKRKRSTSTKHADEEEDDLYDLESEEEYEQQQQQEDERKTKKQRESSAVTLETKPAISPNSFAAHVSSDQNYGSLLNSMWELQKQQAQMLKKLLSNTTEQKPSVKTESMSDQKAKQQQEAPTTESLSMEQHLESFLKSYLSLPLDERTTRLQRFMEQSLESDQVLQEICQTRYAAVIAVGENQQQSVFDLNETSFNSPLLSTNSHNSLSNHLYSSNSISNHNQNNNNGLMMNGNDHNLLRFSTSSLNNYAPFMQD